MGAGCIHRPACGSGRGSFPASLRAGNSNRVFALLCDVPKGVK